MMLRKVFFANLVLAIILFWGCTDKNIITEDHYLKAEGYLRPNIIQKIYNYDVQPNWLSDGSAFWHVANTREGKRFLYTKTEVGLTEELFDHVELAKALTQLSGLEADPANLPFDRVVFTDDNEISFVVNDLEFSFDFITGRLINNGNVVRPVRSSAVSPDGRYEAFIKNYNLYVKDLINGRELQLSWNGSHLYEYAHFYGWDNIIDEESGGRPANLFVNWSPNSRKIQTYITDMRVAEKMYLLDFSIDSLYRPKLLSYYRGSPGDTTIVYHIPVIFDIPTGRQTFIDVDPIPHFMGVNFDWVNSGNSLYALYPHRGFKQIDIIKADAATGDVDVILSDYSDISIEYGKIVHERIGDSLLLFSSERDGWYHLYIYDQLRGELINRVTSGEFVVKGVSHIDRENQIIYFMAGGREEGRNPYYNHFYRVNFDGSDLTLLTSENAHHSVNVSPCGNFFVNNYSTVEQPPVSLLRDLKSGDILSVISEADIDDLIAMGWNPPMQFVVKGRDNLTDLYGIIYKPDNFNQRRSYPLIDYTYTGPQASIVPKSFMEGLINIMHPFKNFGFLVMAVDGLGTAQRSLEFREWSYRNIGSNLDCHVAAIRSLSEKYSWIDTTRIGIFGHSAGGYDVGRAMVAYGEFYKVGVASASDHDHRMEKAWWPEMFMGYPVGDYYHEQSNITNAAGLQGRLLIAHGGIDENVNPSATFKLAEAFINEGKDFDMLILPSRRHSFGRDNGDYFTKVRWNYFIKHLLGAEPVHNYQFKTIE